MLERAFALCGRIYGSVIRSQSVYTYQELLLSSDILESHLTGIATVCRDVECLSQWLVSLVCIVGR